MLLKDLLFPLLLVRTVGDDNIEITGMTADSRKVKEGYLFVCLPGFTVDGHDFAQKAAEQGAVAVLTERELPLPPSVVQAIVPDTRRAMALVADMFYGSPT
ncbi:MAG TPA: Mur ligase domain-containing protein, partial [Candidatus Bathyarchaeia archaeon]|nr:Mur ligase domain-containing protein [Candidatus Bathyarchaeia archaeon]